MIGNAPPGVSADTRHDPDWNPGSLESDLRSRGLRAPAQPLTDWENVDELVAQANEIPIASSLEWLADQFGLTPLDCPRASCPTRAETIFRRLARATDNAAPWLPLGTIGPLLICAHFDPTARDSWGIPRCLFMPVLIKRDQYEVLRADVLARLTFASLPMSNPIEYSPEPPKGGRPKAIANWMLEHYPFTEEESALLRNAETLLGENDNFDPATFKLLPRDYGVAFFRVSTGLPCFNPEYAPPQSFFPDGMLEKHTVYPLYCGRQHSFLLSPDQSSYAFEDEWASTGQGDLRFTMVLADPERITEAINRNRGNAAKVSAVVESGDLTYSDTGSVVEIDAAEMGRINPAGINTTPEQIVHWVLYRAISLRASDLHVEKFYNTARFRVRVDGELRVIHSCSEESLPRYISLIKNYSNMGQRRQAAEDGRFSMRIGKRRVDCRVSAIPCSKDLQKITIRFLDKKDGVRQLSELNLTPRQSGIVASALSRDQGLILVTGPTGSGKTTSLYAFINSINSDSINIHTVEDPIEYEIEGINQTQTDPINSITFAEGLRRILRADPDVILIGESRDAETASAAVNSALTGHLVLSTLHANDSLRAISRLISMGVPPYLLADSLALSQAQRLVRRLCNYCKRPTVITDEMRGIFTRNLVPIPPNQTIIFSRTGCPDCHDTGYAGRIALMEMCPISSALADLIALNAPQSRMREVAVSEGVLTLYQEGLIQILDGQTSLEEIACLSYTALG